jgi:K+-transporting ATPase KdpF subunit
MLKEFDIILGALAAIGLGIYLLYALLHPESF